MFPNHNFLITRGIRHLKGRHIQQITRVLKMKRLSPILLTALLLVSCFPISYVSASGESTTISSFSGGFASVEINLQGGATNNSASIDVPRNVTFQSSFFNLNVAHSDQTPGQVWLDLNEDGVFEWEFNDTGYGDIGHQNRFYNGNTSITTALGNGTSSVPDILVPTDATIQSSNLNIGFAPQVGGGYFQIGDYQQVVESDIDGDGLPEPVFLSAQDPTNYSTTIVWADWNSSGITISTPIASCDNATSLSVGDLNGDGSQDLISFSIFSSTACVHMANGTSFDPVLNLSLSSGLISAKIGDMNKDGLDDIVSIHQMGVLEFNTWSNASWNLASSSSTVINPNGSEGIPANLLSLHSNDFFSNGNESVLVMDSTGHWTNWAIFNGAWGGPLTSFDGINNNEIITDLDGDGDVDLIGSNDQGYAFLINNGTQWNTTIVQTQIDLLDSTISDFDGDGVLDLLTPAPGVADNSNLTIEGNITHRTINSSSLGNVSEYVLEPWSMPTSISTMDMDNDGVLEQIIGAGEISKGVFIGGWHNIELDADGDGTTEMEATGYAGDSANNLNPLMMMDETNEIKEDLIPVLGNLPSSLDSYGIEMSVYSIEANTSGMGQFTFSGLDIGYDCSFLVDVNPHATTNLTNVLNQGMSAGVGNYTVSLPVNSSQAGVVTLSNIGALFVPGAPDLALPIQPTLVLDSVTNEKVVLSWNEVFEFGDDFVEFEIFRLESANATLSLVDVYNTSGAQNMTIDTNISVGSTYWYSVRSVHLYGVTSNMSNTIEVTIPYPNPPSAVEGVVIGDVANDTGGVLSVSWNSSTEVIDHYEVYLENNSFSSISGLTSITSVPSSINSTNLTGLIDSNEYWVAVVAVDQYGNSTSAVVSVGPAYSRNDVPIVLDYEITVTSEIILGSPFVLEIILEDEVANIENGNMLVSMETTSGIYPISTNWDGINLTDFADLGVFTTDIYGDVTFWANFSGYAGDAQNREISSKSVSATSTVNIGATISSSEDTYELDWDNETDVRINIDAANPQQYALLDGATITWSIHNNTTNQSLTGTEQISDNFTQFLINFPGGGILFVNLTEPGWISTGQGPLEISLIPYGTSVEENETDDNDTNPTPWNPDVMNDVNLDCGEVIIDPSVVQKIDCTFTNTNNYSLEISLEPDGWSQWSDFIIFEPSAGQGEFVLNDSESSVIEIRVEVLQNLSENALVNGLIQIDIRQGPKDYIYPGDKPLTFEIQWTLIGEEPVVTPDPGDKEDTGNNSGTSDTSSSSNNMMIFGGIGAVALGGLVIFIVLRIRNSDLDEWGEEDLDMDPEVQTDRISKPLPVGVALDEFEDKTIVDDTPDKPDFISDFDDGDDYVETLESDVGEYESEDAEGPEEEYQEDYTEESEDDSGITVDENGTEWYEDEVGVWWFRDPGEEDWSEFVE